MTRRLPGRALERLSTAHEVDIWSEQLPPGPTELRERAAPAEGLLTLLTDCVDRRLIDDCPHLKAISNYAVGYDNVDVAAATARSIRVGNTPDVLTEATADLTFALLLAAARRLPEGIATVAAGDWRPWEPAAGLGYDVHGATLGIIGLGRIGRAVARRARGFDMHVIHANRRQDLEPVLREADFVSLHCPLTPFTRHLIDTAALDTMKRTAILVNTARGAIVDQSALRRALVDGMIAGAALDVTDPEPLSEDDPLLSSPNLIVVPHIGSATRTAREKMADLAVENLIAGLEGRPMPHQVNQV